MSVSRKADKEEGSIEDQVTIMNVAAKDQ